MILILGAGLAGLSASYHLGHERCVILEKNTHPFGHIHSREWDGFTWDEGPHVSFTGNPYVRELFSRSVRGEYDEYPVRTACYFHGHWIDHPAQSNLYQVPEPLRSECLKDFLATRGNITGKENPANYAEWLSLAFGATFARTFPEAYTAKYWTVPAKELTTDWIGSRVFYPQVTDVLAGAKGPLPEQTHYIKKVRYPRRGGYQSFARLLAEGANIQYASSCEEIDLVRKSVRTSEGHTWSYTRLINTIPLPEFVKRCRQATPKVIEATAALHCSSLLLVNVTAEHPSGIDGNWFYVYDDALLSTRIHLVERLAPSAAPTGRTGVQVEVYAGPERPFPAAAEAVSQQVLSELETMGFIESSKDTHVVAWPVPWANPIFDTDRRSALNEILQWLESYGLRREEDDLSPITNWDINSPAMGDAAVILAGRFAQWKYFWTDDCVLRGRQIAMS